MHRGPEKVCDINGLEIRGSTYNSMQPPKRYAPSLPLTARFLIGISQNLKKRNYEKVVVKILEVDPTEIKYKRFDYQDGPTFTIVNVGPS